MSKKPVPPVVTNWSARNEQFKAALSDAERDTLATELFVTSAALAEIDAGWATRDDLRALGASGPDWPDDFPDGAYSFPERDGAGHIVGFSFRARDGRKGSPSGVKSGAKRGVIIPKSLPALPDPVLIVEGASDVAACVTMGLAAVGRPSNTGGADDLAKLLRGRAVLVVGENDMKPDGRWPGRDGAERIASRLAGEWHKEVDWTLPPTGEKGGDAIKDVRDFLRRRIAGGLNLSDTESCHKIGVELLAALKANVKREDTIELPGGAMPVSEAASRLGERLGKSGNVFERGNVAMMLRYGEHGQPELHPLRPDAAPALFETVAKLTKDGKPATCGEATARLILPAGQFLAALPPVRVLSRCPVLVARGDELITVNAYDRESGVLASGGPVPEMMLTEARVILHSVLTDYRFVSDGDRARAPAALITPALLLGGILRGRSPLDIAEADESQTGKGYLFKLRAAIYGSRVRTVVQKKGGVGGFDESISGALVSGSPFVSFDNLRGRIDSTALESLLTEPTFAARVPYAGEVLIDATRVAFSATSNRAEMTPDLANRASIIRLQHQPEGYVFAKYAEGDLLAHIEADPAPFLGAVFAVVRAWWNAGRPTTGETAHSFRAWAGPMDWIDQHLLDAGPLLGGMAEAKSRLSNPALGWLRAVVLAAVRAGMVGRELRAHDLLALTEDNPDLALSGSEALDLEDEAQRSAALKAIGQRLGRAFNGRASIIIDGYEIRRREEYDPETRRPTKTYCIETRKTPENPSLRPLLPSAPVAPGHTAENLGASHTEGRDSAIESYGPPRATGAHGSDGRNPHETQDSLIDAAPTSAPGWREVTL